MNKDEKAAVIEQVAAQIEESEAIFAVDYRGISVTQVGELRARLAEGDASFRVVKNRLTMRAADQAGAESLKELLIGPTAFTFVRGDAAVAAKTLAQFTREHEILEFKGGIMDGEVLSVEQVQAISKLPARDVLIGQFAGIVASPITGLVRGLGSLIGGLALQLGQIAEQGLVGGEAPSPAVDGDPIAEEPAAEEPVAEEAPPAVEEQATEPEASADEVPADQESSEDSEQTEKEEDQ